MARIEVEGGEDQRTRVANVAPSDEKMENRELAETHFLWPFDKLRHDMRLTYSQSRYTYAFHIA